MKKASILVGMGMMSAMEWFSAIVTGVVVGTALFGGIAYTLSLFGVL